MALCPELNYTRAVFSHEATMTQFSALFALIFLGVSSVAFAVTPSSGPAALQGESPRTTGTAGPAARAPGPRDRVQEPIHQEFDFEGDVIETEYLRPNTAMVETVKKRSSLSLVRIKTSFLDKILSTVDEL